MGDVSTEERSRALQYEVIIPLALHNSYL